MRKVHFLWLAFLVLLVASAIVGVGRVERVQKVADRQDQQLRAIKSAIPTTSGRVTEPKVVAVQPEMVVYGDVPLPAEELPVVQPEPPRYYAPGSPDLPFQNSWLDKRYETVRPDLKASRGNRVVHRKRPRPGTYQIQGGSVTVRPMAYHRQRSHVQRHYRSHRHRSHRSYRAPYHYTCQYWVRSHWVYSHRGRYLVRGHYVPCPCR